MAPAGSRQGRSRVKTAKQDRAQSSTQRKSGRESRGGAQDRAIGRNSQPEEGLDRLSCLPIELLFMIMGDPERSERLSKVAVSLCRVSKRLNDLITPIMYRSFSTFDITGQDNEAIVKPFLFLRTISSRPNLSYHVKSVSLKWKWVTTKRTIRKPDPKLIWKVYTLAGMLDCQLRIPWSVPPVAPSTLRELFLFALMHILHRTAELEKFNLHMSGYGCESICSSNSKIVGRTNLGTSLKGLRQVFTNDRESLPFICSWAPNLQNLELCTGRVNINHYLGQEADPPLVPPSNPPVRLSLGNLRRLNLNSVVMETNPLKELLTSCGPLLSFKYTPKTTTSPADTLLRWRYFQAFSFMATSATTVSEILSALEPHKSTLEELFIHMELSLVRSNLLSDLALDLTEFEKLKMLSLDTSSFEPVGWLADMLPRSIEDVCLLRRVSWFLDVSAHPVKSMRDQLLRFTGPHSRFPSLKKVSFGSKQGAAHHGVSGIEDAFHGVRVEFTSFEFDE